jgi:hypothetical protein
MKRGGQLVTIVIGTFAIAIASLWFISRWKDEQLMSAERIQDEIGLRLPPSVRILAAHSDTWSLVDGDNYDWLIESNISLVPWASQIMRPETGGWDHIRSLSELGPFEGKIPPDTKFGGVWRGAVSTPDGREETSYLFASEDGKLAILSTFRP